MNYDIDFHCFTCQMMTLWWFTQIRKWQVLKVALHPLARATLTFDRQLHYLILIQFYQNYTHIVGKMLEMWMLYSHLQFEFYERRGRHRTHFAFFQNFMWWGTTCRRPNFASQFWYEKHSNLSEFCVSVCRIYRRLTSRSRNIVLKCSSAEIAD